MKRHSIKIMLMALVMSGIILVWLGLCLSAETIKIGIGGAHSGDVASYGISALKGAEYVVEQVNSRGGILGRQVEIVKGDDQCKPELATNVATKMVADKIKVVMGHTCSGATKAALNIYKEDKVICISPSATNTDLTYTGLYPNFFRTIGSDYDQAKAEVEFAQSKGFKKLAVLHDKGDYGKGLAERVKQLSEAEQKMKVVLFEGITPGAVDYSAIIQKVRESGAEAIIFGGYLPEASKLVTGMRKKKMNLAFISTDGIKNDTFLKLTGESAEGVFATGPKDVSRNSQTIQAAEYHLKKWGEAPGTYYLTAVAATQALLQAIEKAGGPDDYQALIKALRTEPVDTPIGRIKFDERGDTIGAGFSVYQVQKGTYVELK